MARTARLAQPRVRHPRLSHTVAEKTEIDFPSNLRKHARSMTPPTTPRSGEQNIPFSRSAARHEAFRMQKMNQSIPPELLTESQSMPSASSKSPSATSKSKSPAGRTSRSPAPKVVIEGIRDKDLEELCRETHGQPPDVLKHLMESVHLILEYEYPPQIEPTWNQIKATFDYDKLALRIQQQSSAGGGKNHHPELIKFVKNKYFVGRDPPLTKEKVMHANRAASGLWRWAAGMVGVEPKLMPRKVSPKKTKETSANSRSVSPSSPKHIASTSPISVTANQTTKNKELSRVPSDAARSASPSPHSVTSHAKATAKRLPSDAGRSDSALPSSPQRDPDVLPSPQSPIDSFDKILRRHSGQGAGLQLNEKALTESNRSQSPSQRLKKEKQQKKEEKLDGFLDNLVATHPAHPAHPHEFSDVPSAGRPTSSPTEKNEFRGDANKEQPSTETQGEITPENHWRDVKRAQRRTLLARRQSRSAKQADKLLADT
eukprot:gnl/MRDRNA2_/MRDRNA2_120401_c0_seq1.p1 gnl/MRDRNA2_/MRDRNA2_120401_c0~~gnl/MRDRNA2_/MRDRNA2_120401_c0_seq1.p1  ORF type:complete len:487 (+),score=84.24 gnl/MRDRNA2_/MRDRNA2_120401_c0_seq1:3-1463(+)